MIEVKNLSKKIGENQVLENINLKLNDGKVYGFQGRNGSGKTMLFRAICGLIGPDTGEVIIDGRPIKKGEFARDVGLLLENPAFIKGLSGLENLKMLASIKNTIGEEKILATLERVGLLPAKDKDFGKYSLGMKQRLAIANVIMEDPQILIFDEPTNAIDEEGVLVLKEIILEEKVKGRLILLASHEREILEEVCDQIFHMREGKIIGE